MSLTDNPRLVYINSEGKLVSNFSTNIILMGELFYENPFLDNRTLTVNTAAQMSVPYGLTLNRYFSTPSNSQLKYTGLYYRYCMLSSSVSGVLAAGTNQLLNFELRLNGVKIGGSKIKSLFKDNTDYQIIHLQKMIIINPDDIIMV
jgi:hypothetical protein